MKKHLILATTVLALSACSESQEPSSSEVAVPAPAVETVQEAQEASPPEIVAEEPQAIEIDAPSGQYASDPAHTHLYFSVKHLGVSNYLVRFTDFDVTLNLDVDDLSASSVQATIDAASISTDFSGDYTGTHPDSPFSSWDEDLAKSENFLNSDVHSTITFTSTRVEPTSEGSLLVTGDLELLGETRPVTLEAHVVGSAEAHPFTGAGLIGFSAEGSFNRSDFGMTHLVNPPIVGDTVTLRFEGEFLQQQGEEAEEEPVE